MLPPICSAVALLALAAPLARSNSPSAAPAPAPRVARSMDEWIPIDDPGLERLPRALRGLPSDDRAAFQSEKLPWFLLARRVPGDGEFASAFAADEAAIAKEGQLVPGDEDYIEIRGDEALFLDCAWKKKDATMKVAALYAAHDAGGLTALWIAAPEDTSSKALLNELKECYRTLKSSFEVADAETYASFLHEHSISFSLRSGRGRDGIRLAPVETTPEGARAFFDAQIAPHNRFVASVARDWEDPERGVTLSMQLVQMDQPFAPQSPFVVWLAGEYQSFVRKDANLGDAPVELVHLEDARTVVVSDEELARHYENNKRAPDMGVILKTFVPKSPYARACRMRYVDPSTGEPSMVLMVELRAYPRGRSETIFRPCVLMLVASAQSDEDVTRIEEGLELVTAPVTDEPPLAELAR